MCFAEMYYIIIKKDQDKNIYNIKKHNEILKTEIENELKLENIRES